MNTKTTQSIMLARTNFGEADRILTCLTPDFGKLKLIAKGVRKAKSKLAGSVELFCVSDIVFAPGRGEISTLTSARVNTFFNNIMLNTDRLETGFTMIKLINLNTEDNIDRVYFDLLAESLFWLNEDIDRDLVDLFFRAGLIGLAGHAPNLSVESNGRQLKQGEMYDFEASEGFSESSGGKFSVSDIKYLRLLFDGASPKLLARVVDYESTASKNIELVNSILRYYLRV